MPAATPSDAPPATQGVAGDAAPAEAAPKAPLATEPPATEPNPAPPANQPQPGPPADAPAAASPTDARPAGPATDSPSPNIDKSKEMPKDTQPPTPAESPDARTPANESPTAPAAKPDTEDLPSPPDETKPGAKAADAVGPVSATKVPLADLAKAIQAAHAADEQMVAARADATDAELKKIRSTFYLSVFRLAEAVTFASEDGGSAQLDDMRKRIGQFVLHFAADEKRVDALKFNAARWLAFPRRTTPGVMLAGSVQGTRPVGRLFEVKLGIGPESGAQSVSILTANDPGVSPGERAFALGTIVEAPSETLAGYEGAETSVVWCGMLLEVPAAK
jgi:hypothetical protein